MCRQNDHGGRRCPADNSDARQRRRLKAQTKHRLQNKIIQPFTNEPKNSVHTNPDETKIFNHLENIKEIDETLTRIDSLKPVPGNQHKIVYKGETLTGNKEKLKQMLFTEKEHHITHIGATINSLVDEKTGITDEEILTGYKRKTLEEVDELIKTKKEINTIATMLEDTHNVEEGNLRKRYNVLLKNFESLREKTQTSIEYGDPETRELMKNRVKETLKIINQFNPLGGEIKIMEHSSDIGAKILNEASQFYPHAWLGNSNNSEKELLIKVSEGRGHYGSPNEENHAELLISSTPPTPYAEDNNFRIAIHELAHRMEDVGHKDIVVLEERFLVRRTTNSDGVREDLKRMVDVSTSGEYEEKELCRPDGFAHAYIGKEYTNGFREVLSIGVESIFAGSNGSLVGFGDYKPDPDMKNFIIGMLSSLK